MKTLPAKPNAGQQWEVEKCGKKKKGALREVRNPKVEVEVLGRVPSGNEGKPAVSTEFTFSPHETMTELEVVAPASPRLEIGNAEIGVSLSVTILTGTRSG